MPWPWAMAQHCLNLQTGTVQHWPFPHKNWKQNAFFLNAMLAVWQAWRFFQIEPARWQPEHIDYYDWLYSDD